MTQLLTWDELHQAHDEVWFQQKEEELIELLRQRFVGRLPRVTIGEAVGLQDEAVLQALQELGYTRPMIELFYQIPLVQIAWASGSVTAREREWVLKLAGLHGSTPERPAYQQLCDWLDKRPSDRFFQTSLRIISYLLAVLPDNARQSAQRNLVNFCKQIAIMSGGFLGYGNKISAGEQEVLDNIVHELQQRNPEAMREVVQGLKTQMSELQPSE